MSRWRAELWRWRKQSVERAIPRDHISAQFQTGTRLNAPLTPLMYGTGSAGSLALEPAGPWGNYASSCVSRICSCDHNRKSWRVYANASRGGLPDASKTAWTDLRHGHCQRDHVRSSQRQALFGNGSEAKTDRITRVHVHQQRPANSTCAKNERVRVGRTLRRPLPMHGPRATMRPLTDAASPPCRAAN